MFWWGTIFGLGIGMLIVMMIWFLFERARAKTEARLANACLRLNELNVQDRARPEPRQPHPLGSIGGERGE